MIVATRRGFSLTIIVPVVLVSGVSSPLAAERDEMRVRESAKAETQRRRGDFILQKR